MTLIQNPRRFLGKFHQVTGPATSTLPGKKQGTAKFDYVYRSMSETMKLCADFMVFDQGAVLSRDLWTREPTASSSRVKSSHLVGARSSCVPGCTSVRGGFFGAVPNSSIEWNLQAGSKQMQWAILQTPRNDGPNWRSVRKSSFRSSIEGLAVLLSTSIHHLPRVAMPSLCFGWILSPLSPCLGWLISPCWMRSYPMLVCSVCRSDVLYIYVYIPIDFATLPQFLNLTTSKTKQFCETSSIFELDNIQNEAILPDFLNFWTWQRPKRSNSARLPHKNWTWQHPKRSNSARLPSKMESWVQSWRPRTNACAIFPVHLSKVLRLPRKSDAGSYEVLHLPRKIILANLQIWCSKMQPLSRNQRPHLLTSLMNMSLVLRLPRKMHLCRSSSNVTRLPSFLEMAQNPHVLLTFDKVHNPLRLPRKTTLQRPKVARTCGALYMLTSKCASHHNGAHFFDISTSKSGPSMVCVVRFDLQMCFAP